MKVTLKYISVLSLAVLFSNCSSTNNLTISVTKPAPVTIPKNINSVGILNRFGNSSGVINKIDQVFSIEGKNLDKEASFEVVEGLKNKLKQLNRFDLVILKDTAYTTDNTFDFPSTLAWDKVDELCKTNTVDALFVLSYFDSDTNVSYNINQVVSKNVLGIEVPLLEHQATSNTLIKGGFKIYDSKNKLILDAYSFSKGVSAIGKGVNPSKALEALKMKKDLVMDTSRQIGENYALSIQSYKIRVGRIYFVKGTDQFEIAKRKAQTGDWDGAAIHWENELNNSKSKIVGRACHNMAIINEINGDLEEAMERASKAYSLYEIKESLRYLNILKNRVAENRRLEEQR